MSDIGLLASEPPAEGQVARDRKMGLGYQLGCAEIERIICQPSALGILDSVQPRNYDAWEIAFPSLKDIPRFNSESKQIKICIATEEITGPVRNGGIGTTYAYLAQTLAAIGCDTTVLYLRGEEIETGTMEHWVEHYAEKGVKFVPVPNYAALDRFQSGGDRWLYASYNMLRWLLDNHCDVVHVSEWHGCGYLSLLAKSQGLAFCETLFIVKTSSPWLWNRLYGSLPIERIDDVTKICAERRSVELADMVIGGSLHLLRWMASQGYQIPRERTFVQPNLVFFDHLRALMEAQPNSPGVRVPIEEVVFFGRLEARKGLFVFCQAISHLVQTGGPLPPKLTFMGKPGARLTVRPDQDVLDFIRSQAEKWPFEVQFLTEYQQYEALEYLLSRPRLAVMPSIIENSSMAVYEAAICGIPFIASSSGGTPELIAEEDRDQVLCEAHPQPLSKMIAHALTRGGYVARPAFINDDNLEVWREFHRNLGRGLLQKLLADRARQIGMSNSLDYGQTEAHAKAIGFSLCLYHAGPDDALEKSIESINGQDLAPLEVIVAVDCPDYEALARAKTICAKSNVPAQVIEAFNFDSGLAFNEMARRASGEYYFFAWSGVEPRPECLRALSGVARSTNADVLNFFYRVTFPEENRYREYLRAMILGSVTESFFQSDLTAIPLAVRATRFFEVDGFSADYRVLGCELEFIARCQLFGLRCETALLDLARVPGWEDAWLKERGYDQVASHFRIVRPQIASSPLAMRDLLLLAKGMQLKPAKVHRPPRRLSKSPETTAQSSVANLFKALVHDVLFSDRPARPTAAAPALADAARKGSASPGSIQLSRGSAQLMHEFGLVELAGDGAALRKGRKPSANREMRERLYAIRGAGSLNLTGQLLGVHKGVAYGWVRDEDRPSRVVGIDVVENGDVVGRVSASENLDLAVRPPVPLLGHGFAIKVESLLDKLKAKYFGRHLILRIADSDATLAELHLKGTNLADAGYAGYCDANEFGNAQGWAWKPDEPEKRANVVIIVDDKILGTALCAVYRSDLDANGIGSGDHGFRFQLPKALRDGVRRVVHVKIAETGALLNRGKLILEGNKLTPTA
jgi:glycosyltransferase involved in cell wall biosynthesis